MSQPTVTYCSNCIERKHWEFLMTCPNVEVMTYPPPKQCDCPD